MSELTKALNRILNWLEQNSALNLSSLQPGLSDDEIDEIVRDLPFKLPTEVRELYKWRNGSENQNNICESLYLFQADRSYGFYSLQSAIENTISINRFHYGKCYELTVFFTMAEWSGSVLIDPNLNQSRVVFSHHKECWWRDYQYTSLTNMMLTVAECYETNAYNYPVRPDLINPDIPTTKIWWKYNSDIADILLEELQKPTSEIWELEELGDQLVQFKDSRFVEPLINALQGSLSEDINKEIRSISGTAARILGWMEDVRAVEPLIAALQSGDEMTRWYAPQSLAMLKDDRAIQPLINMLIEFHLLTDIDPLDCTVSAAANALVELKAVDALIELLNHNNPKVRDIAAALLGFIKDSRAIEPLSRLLEDTNSSVRETVTQVLDELGKTD